MASAPNLLLMLSSNSFQILDSTYEFSSSNVRLLIVVELTTRPFYLSTLAVMAGPTQILGPKYLQIISFSPEKPIEMSCNYTHSHHSNSQNGGISGVSPRTMVSITSPFNLY